MRCLIILAAWLLPSAVLLADPPPKGAVIVPIDLTDSVIRVTAKTEHTPPENLKVAIGFSEHLLKPPSKPQQQQQTVKAQSTIVFSDPVANDLNNAFSAPAVEYKTVAESLPHDAEFHGVFESGLSGTVVGVLVKRKDVRDQLLIEIRPMYVLPSGDKQQLTSAAGRKQLRKMQKLVAQAHAAERAAPNLKRAVNEAKQEYENHMLEVRRNSNGQTIRQFASRGPTPMAAANMAARRGRTLANQLARAEQLAGQKKAIESEATAVVAVAEYSALIADDAAIYVQILDGETPVAADVR